MGLIRTSKGTSLPACRAAISLKRDVGHWCVIRRARITTGKRRWRRPSSRWCFAIHHGRDADFRGLIVDRHFSR